MKEEQFLRISRLIGQDNINELHKKHVTILGIGAVGSSCLEFLVRSGVGSFTLIDFDKINYSNINRQLIATHSTVGRLKVEVAKERALDINPYISVEALPLFINEDNALDLLKKADVVLDCIDSLNPKINTLAVAIKNNIKIISSMGAALRRDVNHIRCADISQTWACPLARQVRAGLRKRGIDKGLRVVFSPEEVNFKYTKVEDEVDREPGFEQGRERVILGSTVTITSIFGSFMANEALKALIGDKEFEGKIAWNAQDRDKGAKN